ncbi:FtsX-like permease family protein [uncultured Campylobacter sp.]|uniref:FtsX-like permease family protein n=1 Tax=uncultured Campylobacter sp. TaxID=218934 RepID=UPI0026303804|nr:FtsX-like permease family protein [uncultured Campylobacter sp.]
MKFFRTHLSLILPLFFMTFAFECILIINQTVKHYEQSFNEDYNIIIVSKDELRKEKLQAQLPQIFSLRQIDSKYLLERVKNDISQNNLVLLEKSLPKFYSLKLDYLPHQSELNEIKQKLSSMSGISKVEVFAKTYDNVYTLLNLVKSILWLFLFIIILLSLVLFLKQMRIWLYEHTERIEIMCLFGAAFWFRSLILYKIVIFDCFVACALLFACFEYVFSLDFIANTFLSLNMQVLDINFLLHISIIFTVTIIVSLLCVNSVMFKVKK